LVIPTFKKLATVTAQHVVALRYYNGTSLLRTWD